MAYDSKYAIELWSPTGQLLADFSGRAMDRSFSKTRNDADTINWKLNLDEFENYCRLQGLTPTDILQPGFTEVRVRRGGTYVAGGQVTYAMPALDANNQSISIAGNGFLNLFKDRRTPLLRTFTNVDASTIASTLITETQNGGNIITNSDFETNITGWTGGLGASVLQSNIRSYIGTYSLEASISGINQYVNYDLTGLDTTATYQAGIWIYLPTGQQVSILLSYGGATGLTPQTYNGNDAWQFIKTNPQLASLTTASLQIMSLTAGTYKFYVDAAIAAIGDTLVSPIIDGVNIRSFGITIGNLATVGTHIRNYKRDDIKSALQELTQVQVAPFDMEFTPDKVFNTYASIGSTRNDIIFEHPRNIKAVSFSIDATSLGNQIIGLGTGNGDLAQLVYPASDIPSQKAYKLRERIFNSSATDNSDNGLTDGTATELAKWSNPIRLLNLTIDGNKAPYVTDYTIGDRVPVNINGYGIFSQINGLYRIEKITVNIDENDNEEVTLVVSA